MSTKPQPSIDAERAKKLAVELSGLLRQQLEALEDSAYILMDEETRHLGRFLRGFRAIYPVAFTTAIDQHHRPLLR